MSAPGDGDLEELSQQLQVVESQLEALQQEVQGLRVRQREIDEAIEAIETLETGSVVQVPIGGGAYVRAAVEDIDEVIVGIGGSYATQQTEAEAVEVLEDRHDRLEDRIDELTEVIAELQQTGEQIGQRAQQELIQRQQEASTGQGGGGPLGGQFGPGEG